VVVLGEAASGRVEGGAGVGCVGGDRRIVGGEDRMDGEDRSERVAVSRDMGRTDEFSSRGEMVEGGGRRKTEGKAYRVTAHPRTRHLPVRIRTHRGILPLLLLTLLLLHVPNHYCRRSALSNSLPSRRGSCSSPLLPGPIRRRRDVLLKVRRRCARELRLAKRMRRGGNDALGYDCCRLRLRSRV
jgi:hypothetical protein